MSTHKLLNNQLKKYLPESLQKDPDVEKLISVINDSYNAFERDKELSDRAFSISEEEYVEINTRLKYELEVKRRSVEKIKKAIGTITGTQKTSNTDDLLMIASYLNQQVNKRKEAEMVFASLITNTQNAILLEDENRHIVFTNQQFCNLFGLTDSPESLQGTDCTNCAEQSKELFRKPELFVSRIVEILSEKKPVNGEMLKLADGRIFERDYIPIFLEKKYKGHFWSYTDITESRKAQIAIEKSERTNRLIMNAALDAIVIINSKAEIIFWNPQAEKIFGWKASEIKGKKLIETIVPHAYRQEHEKGMHHFHETGEGPALNRIRELTAVDKNNNEFPIELSMVEVRQESNVFFCGFIRDISKRKKAESELKASQELWQFALEGAGDGVWEYDFETNEIFFSKQYKKMLGYEDDEFENKTEEWLSRIHPDDIHIIEETDGDYLENQVSSHQKEYRIKHKNGNYLWVLDRGKIINYTSSGKPKRIIGTHTDITERKRVEAEYMHISAVASANENGVLFTDSNGNIVWSNEGFVKLTGYSHNEIKNFTPLQLCKGPLSNKEALKTMLDAFYEGRSFSVEVVHYRKDKSWFWGKVSGQAMLDGKGNVIQYFAIVEDISEEKEREEQFQSLAENIPGVLYRYEILKNGEERLAYMSPGSENKIGITKEQFIDFYTYLHPDDTAREKEITRLSRLKKIPYHFEGRFQIPGKPVIWLNISSSYLMITQEGNMVSTGIITNTTKEKEAGLSLQIKEEKYRSIIANMNLGLMEVDTEEIIQFVNQSFCDMSGYTNEELIGKKASNIFVSGAYHDKMEKQNEMRKHGISDAYEIALTNKRGEEKWWFISGAPRYDDKGEMVGSIGIHLDITQQKSLELELIEAKKLAESYANTKQTFLANMSHEIRTPMNAILGMTNQLNKTLLNQDQQFYLNIIHSATDNLLVIVNEILDLSKIEAGKLSLEKIGFEPKLVVNKVMQIMMHKAEEKGLAFTNSFCDSRLSEVLIGDPYRLNQVILNLISNSIKFTEKGSIDIRCEVVAEDDLKQTIKVTVEDTGIGMDPAFAKNLFNKFTQEDESITRRFGGTGLGMNICNELVNLMHGKIEVESVKGEGTSVSFIIPFRKGCSDQLPVKASAIVDTGIFRDKKILITDDNEMNRLVASTILNGYGVITEEAQNGSEAIEKIKKENFDVVLMDVQMPVMDGIEAIKIIRDSISKTIPVIALTAFALKGDDTRFLNAGMNDYLSKPFEEHLLLQVVAKWLKKEKTHPEIKTTEHNTAPLYDLSKLLEIGKGNQAFVDKMVHLFIVQIPLAINEMEEAFLQHDFTRITSVTHRIKPSVDSMGIGSLKNEIRQIEILALENKQSDELTGKFQQVKQTLEKVVESLKGKPVLHAI